MSWVYVRSEPGLWTVGFHDPTGNWHSDSDHGEQQAAAQRARYLNGSPPTHIKSGVIGDLYQIVETHGRTGWLGAIVMATKIKPWGIQGFVHHVDSHVAWSRAYIRLKWEEIELVGHANLIPADDLPAIDPVQP